MASAMRSLMIAHLNPHDRIYLLCGLQRDNVLRLAVGMGFQ